MSERTVDLEKIERGVRLILEGIGEDADRPGIADTPRRVAKMYAEICEGLHLDPAEFLKVVPDETHDEMIVVKNIPLYSICEHHLVPFHGVAHIAYVPDDGRILGLSKLARIVDRISRRPQIQERLTSQIAGAIEEAIRPRGVGVVIEAFHLCMAMRGVERQNAYATTSALRGAFESHDRTRNEFLSFLRRDIGK